MEPKNILDVNNRYGLRSWLEAFHNIEKECWVKVKRGKADAGTFRYLDAVEEALCFGWIDSTEKKLESGITVQRLTPRKKNSLWSELNKERCRRLEKLGLMTDAGRAVLPDMSPNGFVICNEILEALKCDNQTWENFNNFPPLYIRVRVDTIQIKRKQPELFYSRLRKFVENTKLNVMYGEWNDGGRLIDTDTR
ncbi:MAG: YdeI/OmpD-associated family protein [Clostridia bacterium]|nr:YdeI/OmpD-associated family protein [Clostridia bacterium]